MAETDLNIDLNYIFIIKYYANLLVDVIINNCD